MNIAKKIVKGSTATARARRHFRVRKKVVGTTERPRLVVTRSARHLVAQIVDDSKGHTLASASTMEADLRAASADKTKKARTVGQLVADRAKAAWARGPGGSDLRSKRRFCRLPQTPLRRRCPSRVSNSIRCSRRKIAYANRRKEPLFLFAAMQRHLGYPHVPKRETIDQTLELIPQMQRRIERLEARMKLMEEEHRQGIDITKFYGKNMPPMADLTDGSDLQENN